ncbi:YceI family protein [Luteimonas composti]|uniref:YceI family protein n=1 Tax=Luteimonas composti TaxID=398257 RepID=A0ABT6MMS5_9GAMM|nr:YceI family protein [Luteimonas composti]MDH7451890.1 YceI family protein [Luteimonas composti]
MSDLVPVVRRGRWLALLGLATALAMPAACAGEIDPAQSRIGFQLKTRWGQALEGRFPEWSGEIVDTSERRRQVRLRLPAGEVEILGHPRYSKITRGAGFFDADHHPWVEFVSDPYTEDLLREGGLLGGALTIRGVRRREVFTLEPASCARPTIDCDVVASGVVYRSDYAMDRWGFALSDRVVFNLRIRTRPTPAP